MASFKEVHVSRADSFVVDGNRAAINWIFEYTGSDGQRHRINEMAYQLWQSGKIVQERFYYDPAQRQDVIEVPLAMEAV
jgi:hypothetical protein